MADSLDDQIDSVYRDWIVPGVPASGKWKPPKPDIRALLKALRGRSEVRDSFTAKPDGFPSQTDTGQDVVLYSTIPDGVPRVIDGKLTFAADGPAGGYYTVETATACHSIGARFTLGPYTTPNGAVAIVLFNEFPNYSVDPTIPGSSCHLVISAETWEYGAFAGDGTPLAVLRSGTFDPPLVADSTTIHGANAVLDVESGVAFVYLPDGQVVRVVDIAITRPCRFPTIEPYRNNSGGTDSLPEFVDWWADNYDKSLIVKAYRDYEIYVSGAIAVNNISAADVSLTLSGTPTLVPGLTTNVFVPKSRRVMARATVFLDVTSDGLVFLQFYAGVTALADSQCVATKVAHSGLVTVEQIIEYADGSEFEFGNLQLKANMAGGAGTIKVHNGGSDAFAPVMSAQGLLP